MKQKRKLHIEELDSFEIFDFLDNSKETEHLHKKTYLHSKNEYRKTNLLSIIRANHALINELDEYLEFSRQHLNMLAFRAQILEQDLQFLLSIEQDNYHSALEIEHKDKRERLTTKHHPVEDYDYLSKLAEETSLASRINELGLYSEQQLIDLLSNSVSILQLSRNQILSDKLKIENFTTKIKEIQDNIKWYSDIYKLDRDADEIAQISFLEQENHLLREKLQTREGQSWVALVSKSEDSRELNTLSF